MLQGPTKLGQTEYNILKPTMFLYVAAADFHITLIPRGHYG